MAIKTFLTAAGDSFTVANSNVEVIGSNGSQTVLVNSGITGTSVDANVERIDLSGNMSTYKFVAVSGIGLQIQDVTTGAVVGTLGGINQNVTLAFADGSTPLVQSILAANTFTIGGQAVVIGATTASTTLTPTTGQFDTTVKSAVVTTTTPTTTTPVVSIAAGSSVEGNATADDKKITFAVTLDVAPTATVTVPWSTSSGTTGTTSAISNTDFVGVTSGTLTFASGSKTPTTALTVDLIEDTTFELTETFTVTLGTPTGATLSTTAKVGTGTITNDDTNATPVLVTPTGASSYIGVNSTVSGVSVSDTNDGNMTVQVDASSGGLVTGTTGATSATVLSAANANLSGLASATIYISGSIADVNTVLSGLKYQTNRIAPGVDTITVKATDPNVALDPTGSVKTATFDVNVGLQKTLTTSTTDDFSTSGTGGGDQFVATSLTLQVGDKIGGADGTDTLLATIVDGSGFFATGQTATAAWTSIEVVDLTSGTATANPSNFFDGDSVTGLTTLNYTDADTTVDSLTLLDLPTGIAVNLKSDMGAVSIGAKAASSTATINLASGVDIGTSLTVAASTVKPATLNIVTAGTTGNFITAFAAPGATVNISGTAALTFGTALATGVKIADTTGSLATVDATNLAGALKIDLADHITTALTIRGGTAADTIVGSINVANTISGNGGNDTISLSTNAVDGNTLSGNAGDDTITGGTGADTINGGAGKDTMTGGVTGINTFVFTTGDSTSVSTTWDSIADLKSTDKVDLSGYGILGTNNVALTTNAGTKAANGTKEAYIDTSNQLLIIETSDSGTAVTHESISIGIAALGALTGNGAGVYTAGPVAMTATNDGGGNLVIKGTPIGYPTLGTSRIDVNIDNLQTGSDAAAALANADSTVFHPNDGITITITAPVVDMNGDNVYRNTTVVQSGDVIGTNGANNVDASMLTANGVDVAGNISANILIGSLASDVISGGGGNDTITGNAGADTLSGGIGNDTITGGADVDTITGGAGVDTIDGGTGGDTITGGTGADVMTGGTGADTFPFVASDSGLPSATNFDTITDYTKTAGTSFDIISATAMSIATQTAAAGVGVATITAGVATFNAADTTLAQHIAAVAAAQNAAAWATTIWQEGADTFVYISDGTLAVAAADVLIKLTGVTAGAWTTGGTSITAMA